MALIDRIKPHIRNLEPYQPGKPIEEVERELGIEGAVKLASNESPLGPSPRALAAVREALDGVHRYPDGASHALRVALADRLEVQPHQLVFGAGADEVLELPAKILLGPVEPPAARLNREPSCGRVVQARSRVRQLRIH